MSLPRAREPPKHTETFPCSGDVSRSGGLERISQCLGPSLCHLLATLRLWLKVARAREDPVLSVIEALSLRPFPQNGASGLQILRLDDHLVGPTEGESLKRRRAAIHQSMHAPNSGS